MTKAKSRIVASSGLARRTPSQHEPRRQRLIDALSATCIAHPGLTVTMLEAVIPPVLERCELCRARQLDRELVGARSVTHAAWARWRVALVSSDGSVASSAATAPMLACDAHVKRAADFLLTLDRLERRQLKLPLEQPQPQSRKQDGAWS